MAAPVVDSNDRLVGVVTVDDVVEVIEQEAEEDAKLLAGVGDERLSDSVRQIVPPRFSWLFVNLFTAHTRLIGHCHIRHHHREHGGARGADADRGVDGRQCRNADNDGRRARPRHQGAQPGEHPPRRAARDGRRPHQRACLCVHHGADCRRLVRHAAAGAGHRRGDGRQHASRRSRRHLYPAGARPAGLRSGRGLDGFRDDGDGRGGILSFLGLATLWLR